MKTNKLCVIDLASIVDSAHGHDSIRYPTDQKLLPGVKDAIDRLKADGWHLAIVSNQGACDFTDLPAWCLLPGRRFKVDCSDEIHKVWDIAGHGNASTPLVIVWTGTQNIRFGQGDQVLVQYKTIESTIEEVQFAADLCEIEEAYFCPDIEGKVMYSLGKGIDCGWRSMTVSGQDFEDVTGLTEPKYRLPNTGMLSYAESSRTFPVTDRLMIGDRNSIQAAAKAGFRYMSAQELIKT